MAPMAGQGRRTARLARMTAAALVAPAQGTDGRVTLAAPAPSGGQIVQLFATNGVQVPAQVVVAAGSKTARFHAQTPPGSNSYVATITAYFGSLGASVPLKVAE